MLELRGGIERMLLEGEESLFRSSLASPEGFSAGLPVLRFVSGITIFSHTRGDFRDYGSKGGRDSTWNAHKIFATTRAHPRAAEECDACCVIRDCSWTASRNPGLSARASSDSLLVRAARRSTAPG